METDYHNYQLPKNTGNKRESGADYISGNEGNAQNALSIISRKINAWKKPSYKTRNDVKPEPKQEEKTKHKYNKKGWRGTCSHLG